MRTVQFEDLNSSIQEKLIQEQSQFNSENWDCDTSLDWFVEIGKVCGFIFDVSEIRYNGFGSQGDGASFTGHIDVQAYVKYAKETCEMDREFTTEITTVDIIALSSRYKHERTCQVANYCEVQGEDSFEVPEYLWKTLEQKRLNLCKIFYKNIETQYNDASDENIVKKQIIDENRWYSLDGERYFGEKQFPVHDYQIILNTNLVKKQNLSMEQIVDIFSAHAKITYYLNVLEEMNLKSSANIERCREIAHMITGFEFNLQSAWGFEQDIGKHRQWKKLPGCTCPKDEDVLPDDMKWVDDKCPYHGNLLDV